MFSQRLPVLLGFQQCSPELLSLKSLREDVMSSKFMAACRILEKIAKEQGDEELAVKGTADIHGGVHEKEVKPLVKLELLAFKPTKEEDMRVR